MNEEQKNPIITPADQERWPLLEMASRSCEIPITPADEEAIMQMDQVLDALDEHAAGLAAVQIGFPHRIFLLRNGKDKDGNATNNVYINPTIVKKSKDTKRGGEACLSIPGMDAMIPRPKSITIEYFDLDGNMQEETFRGFWARCVSHEMDHLNGTIISHHLEKQLSRRPRRSKCGMVLDRAAKLRVANRRRKNKEARKARSRNRS